MKFKLLTVVLITVVVMPACAKQHAQLQKGCRGSFWCAIRMHSYENSADYLTNVDFSL